MYLEIATTHRPATDLGYLAHKNPSAVREVELAFGKAVVFYPRADAQACALAMVLDVDPIGIVRGGMAPLADHYVNDRPYAAGSFMSVAIGRVLGSAMGGRSKERPELAAAAIPLRATVGPVPVRGDPDLARRLFEPLGYATEVVAHALDPFRPEWGPSPYVTLRLDARIRLSDLLTHLYVLLPVLDLAKHYWISDDEVEKLLAKGGEWLQRHPERDEIVRRYLHRSRALAADALARLADAEGTGADAPPPPVEPRLHDARLDLVARILAGLNARRVLDLGCGEGRLVERLVADPGIRSVTAVDVGTRDLALAAKRLARLPLPQREKATFLHGSLLYRDDRLRGHDAAALVEVVEHVDPSQLHRLERNVFGLAAPRAVVVTTPNRDHNALFPGLADGGLRHPDHRFEFDRAEFTAWTGRVAAQFGYAVEILPVGEPHPFHGPVSQMAVFTK